MSTAQIVEDVRAASEVEPYPSYVTDGNLQALRERDGQWTAERIQADGRNRRGAAPHSIQAMCRRANLRRKRAVMQYNLALARVMDSDACEVDAHTVDRRRVDRTICDV